MNIIDEINKEQIKEIPAFSPGDDIIVQVRVKEGERERLQAFEGVVIAIKNRGVNSSFTVRKISHGFYVDRYKFEAPGASPSSFELPNLPHSRIRCF